MNIKIRKSLAIIVLLLLGGCITPAEKTINSTVDTTYKLTTNIKGDTLNITPMVNGKANGQFRSYYDNGKLWGTSQYVNGEVHGKSFLYTENGDTAVKEIWKNNILWEKKVYWQAVPYTNDKTFYWLSDTGIYTVRKQIYLRLWGTSSRRADC